MYRGSYQARVARNVATNSNVLVSILVNQWAALTIFLATDPRMSCVEVPCRALTARIVTIYIGQLGFENGQSNTLNSLFASSNRADCCKTF